MRIALACAHDAVMMPDSVIVCVTTFREYILQNVITSEMGIMHDRPEVTPSIKFEVSSSQAIQSSIYSLMAKRNLSTKS